MDFYLNVCTCYDLCGISIPVQGIQNRLSIAKHIELEGLKNNLEPKNPVLSIIYLDNSVMFANPTSSNISRNYFLISEFYISENNLVSFDHKSLALSIGYLDYNHEDLVEIFPELEEIAERWGIGVEMLLAIIKYNFPSFSLS